MWAPSLRSIIPSLGLLLLLAIPQACSKPTPSLAWNVIPANASSQPSTAQYTSSTYGLDAPHVSPINSSAWDWWYFDVVSSDAKTSVIVVFYTAPGTGFVFNQAPPTNLVLATISVGVPGDPQFFQMGSYGTQAKVASTLQGASGSWDGTGFEFIGSPDLSEYTIFINSKDIGVKGQITFKSVCMPLLWCENDFLTMHSILFDVERTCALPLWPGQSWPGHADPSQHRLVECYSRRSGQSEPGRERHRRVFHRCRLPRQCVFH